MATSNRTIGSMSHTQFARGCPFWLLCTIVGVMTAGCGAGPDEQLEASLERQDPRAETAESTAAATPPTEEVTDAEGAGEGAEAAAGDAQDPTAAAVEGVEGAVAPEPTAEDLDAVALSAGDDDVDDDDGSASELETASQPEVEDAGDAEERDDEASANAGADLWGSNWQLVDLGGRSAMGQVRATLQFPEEGRRAVGNASCNRFFGQVQVDGESIAFIDVGTMRMACRPAILDQEQRFLAALESAERYEMDEGELRVFGGDSERPMTFSRILDAS